jgi:aromatic-amino-acid transaminase
MPVYSHLQPAPADPILGVTEAYHADQSPDKVNLGVGVYVDEAGEVPLHASVRLAEKDMAAHLTPHGYLPQVGLAQYNTVSQALVFGANSPALQAGRVVTMQAVGGTGALRIGAGLLALADPDAEVLISNPSWENHRLLFSRAGFTVSDYHYYDAETRAVNLPVMLADLEQAVPGTIVVLHGCCHNPTGADLTQEQWTQVAEVLARRGLVPFIDLAYQGLSGGLIEDRFAVDAMVATGVDFLVANSYSKTFGLYGERVGAIHFVAADEAEAARVLSQAKTVVRSLYSSPSTHGAAIVGRILGTPELRALWKDEVATMRTRIKSMRAQLRAGLEAARPSLDVSHITKQAGMFSYSGLSVVQMRRLREEFHVYGLDSGRICVAAVNPSNIERVVAALAAVR